MSFSDLLKPCIKVDNLEIQSLIKMKGFLKRRSQTSIRQKFGVKGGDNNFFQFFDRGRILAFFTTDTA